jgi:GT2 family glycosyltransferase/glycosyltransferase involved in cell wall biosynthesis
MYPNSQAVALVHPPAPASERFLGQIDKHLRDLAPEAGLSDCVPLTQLDDLDSISAFNRTVIVIVDPGLRSWPAWFSFYAQAFRLSRGMDRLVVCERQWLTALEDAQSRVCKWLGAKRLSLTAIQEDRATPAPDTPSHELIDARNSIVYEYLTGALTRRGEPDYVFLTFLFTVLEKAAGNIELPAGFLEAALIEQEFIGALEQLTPVTGEDRHTALPFPDAEIAHQRIAQLEQALEAAQRELVVARLFTQGLFRCLHTRPQPQSLVSSLFTHRKDTPDFDEDLYLACYPDVADAVQAGRFTSARQHWMEYGQHEGRLVPHQPERFDIPQYFDESGYLRANPDVAEAVARGDFASGFDHWTREGLLEARPWTDTAEASPTSTYLDLPDSAGQTNFDEDLYLFFNPDVDRAVRSGRLSSGFEHWQQYGRFEYRSGGTYDLPGHRGSLLQELAARPYGANVYGFYSTPSGLGSVCRGVVDALRSRTIAMNIADVPGWQHNVERHNPIRQPYRVNLILQNADMMARFLSTYGRSLLSGCYNIAYWLWELPSCRMDWFEAYRYADEIWVASEYCKHAFQCMTKLPVRRIPLVVDGLDEQAIYGREHFDLPTDVFVFCYIFDISSQIERKNPECLIRAFKNEFGERHDVLLYLKCSNSAHSPALARRIERLAKAPNIRLVDELFSAEEIVSLHKVIDCFVSPHRSEGFGLNMAEAMYFGKPVIATGYSANTDFMSEDDSYLIDFRLTTLEENAGPYLKHSIWAEPSIDHLQYLMRRVFEKADERSAKGRRAATRIRRELSADAVGRLMEARFKELGLDRQTIHPPTIPIEPHGSTPFRLFIPGLTQQEADAVRALSYKPLISVITPVYNIAPEYLQRCIESVRAQIYPYWELCICDDASTREDTRALLAQYQGIDPRIKIVYSDRNLGIAGASNRAVEISSGEFIAMLDNDDEITPDALFEIAKALNADQTIDFLYTDEDKIAENGSLCDHYFKPDWSPEHLCSVMYVLHMLVIRKRLFYAVGAFHTEYSGAQDYDLALRIASTGANIHHIPKILYHWRKVAGSAAERIDAKPSARTAAEAALEDYLRRTGTDAQVLPGKFAGSFRVRHRIPAAPPVSLCILTDYREGDIPGRGRIQMLEHFVKSIAAKTDYPNYQLLLVDHNNLPARTKSALAGIEYRVVSYTGPRTPFNYSRKVNFALRHVNTELLVLLNDDMEVLSGEWLSALLEYAQQPQIGAVGARLLFPNQTLQHAGIVIGVNGSAAHVYHSYPADMIGYNGYTHLIRNYSAVTGACLATRKTVFEEVGGFDENFAVDFNDVDFCLSVQEKGYRIVYTPYSELFHFEGVSTQRRSQNPAEVARFVNRWQKYIANDPYYNPNLSRTALDFSMMQPLETPCLVHASHG